MIRKVVLAVSVLIAACVVATIFFLDAAAARILTTAGSHVLGTTTTVRSVHLGIFETTSSLNELQIAQPTGFGDGAMIAVQRASITVGLSELLSHDILIDEILIDGVEVHLVEAGGKVNLQVVANTVAGTDDAATSATSTTPATSAPPSSGAVTIRSLKVTNIRVNASGNSALADGQTVQVTIPDIIVTDLGSKTPMSEVATRVTTELMDRLLIAIVEAKIQGLPSQMLSGLTSASSTLSDVTSSILRESGDAIQKGLKGAGDAIKGLFGK